jgi:branched-chain amino acid transport system substrate-binding protein
MPKAARSFRAVALLTVMLALGTGALWGEWSRRAEASSHPIKIGILYGLTGFAAIINTPIVRGHEVALAEINQAGGVLGRKLEYVVRDDRTNPDVGVRMANELIHREKVDVLMGTMGSNVALAVSEVAKRSKVPFVVTYAKTDALTAEKFHRYVFRVATTTMIEGRALAEMERNTPATRYYTIAFDYEYGRKVIEAFVAHLKKIKPQAEIVGQAWPRLGQTEWTAQVTAILAAKPDVHVNFIFGDAFTAFLRQAKPYGYFDKVRVITGAEVTSTQPPIIGKDLPAGITGNAYSLDDHPDTPAMRRYVELFRKVTGESYYPGDSIQGYIGTHFAAEAIRRAGTTDVEKVVDAMERVTLQTPVGELRIRPEDHQANRGQFWGVTVHRADAPFPVLQNVRYIPAESLWMSLDELKKVRTE